MDDAMHREDALTAIVRNSPLSIVLTDPRQNDNPITYVNRAFQETTLFSREFAVGRNCRFLQGPETDPEDVQRIRDGIARRESFEVHITNHRADGSAFRNQLLVSPIWDDDGELTAFFGVQRELSSGDADAKTVDLLAELQHRVKNHLSMVVSMIRVQARKEVTPDSLRAISRRIEALALLYEDLSVAGLDARSGRDVAAGGYVNRVATVIAGLESRPAIRVNVACDDITMSVDQAARFGLLLSELLTNALEHAFEGREGGEVMVRFQKLDDGCIRLTVEDDGIGLPEGSAWPQTAPTIEDQVGRAEQASGELDTTGNRRRSGVGGSIVLALTQSLGAELDVRNAAQGTIVTVEVRPQP